MLQLDSGIWRARYGLMVSSHIQFQVDEMRSPTATSCFKGEYPLNTICFCFMRGQSAEDSELFVDQVLESPDVKKIFFMDSEKNAHLILEFQSDSKEMQILLQYGHYVKPFTNLQ